METIPFDTHAFVKKLVAAGFTQQQAEAQVQVLARLVYDQLATKRDLKDLELAMKRDLKDLEVALTRHIKDLEFATKRDMKELELRLTIRLGAMMAVAVGIVAVLDKLL